MSAGARIRWWGWLLITAVFAIAAHVVTVYATPYAVMWLTMRSMATAGADNHALVRPRATAQSRSVVRPSPDLLYVLCVYDLAKGSVKISAPVPDSYWSLSIFAANTDNFFVINDQQVADDTFTVILAKESDASTTGGEIPVVLAPSERGIVLFRTLIASEDQFAELDALRQKSRCAPL